MARGSRAQTSVDFAVAMGVFLLALTTVIAFMPTMTAPFAGNQENPLMADRLAAQLVDGQLGDPSEPSQLNATCTMHFFNGTDNPSTGGDPCPSFDPEDSVTTKLGVGEDEFVNVTMQKDVAGGADPETVCAEQKPGPVELMAPSDSDCHLSSDPDDGVDDVMMQAGPEPPTAAGSVTLARRMVVLSGERVFLVVRVW